MKEVSWLSLLEPEELPVVVVTVENGRIVDARVERAGWLAAMLDLSMPDRDMEGPQDRENGSHRMRR